MKPTQGEPLAEAHGDLLELVRTEQQLSRRALPPAAGSVPSTRIWRTPSPGFGRRRRLT